MTKWKKRVLQVVVGGPVLLLLVGFVGGTIVERVDPEGFKAAQDYPERLRAEARARKASEAAIATAAIGQRIDVAMNEALDEVGVHGNWTWEQTSGGWLAVTVEIPKSEAFKARLVGTQGVVAVRNQFYQQKVAGLKADSYRVTVNGPKPGPDMMLRYGSARLNGGQVAWESGLPKILR